MTLIKPLEDPAEQAHGGVVVSHGLSGAALKHAGEHGCQLIAPSLGVEFASNIPSFGGVYLLGGERTLRELPSHGFRIYDRDIWSGSFGDVSKSCQPLDRYHIEGSDHNCAAAALEALAPFRRQGDDETLATRVLGVWDTPPSGQACDTEVEALKIRRDWADIADAWVERVRAGGREAEVAADLLQRDMHGGPYPSEGNPILLRALRACRGRLVSTEMRTQLLACAAEEIRNLRRADHLSLAYAAATLIRDQSSERCDSPTAEEMKTYFRVMGETRGHLGQEPGAPTHVAAAQILTPEEILAGETRLVPDLSIPERMSLAARQAPLKMMLQASIHKRTCSQSDTTQRSICQAARATELLVDPDPAEIARTLDPEALCAAPHLPESVRQACATGEPHIADALAAEVRAAFKEVPAGYHEAKTYGTAPLALFDRIYTRSPTGLPFPTCGIPVVSGPSVTEAIRADAGLFVARPMDLVAATIGDQRVVGLGEDYNAHRNALFRLADLGVPVSVEVCRDGECSPAEIPDLRDAVGRSQAMAGFHLRNEWANPTVAGLAAVIKKHGHDAVGHAGQAAYKALFGDPFAG